MTSPATSPTRAVDGVELPQPGAWKVDPGHAEVGFVGRHLMFTKVRGRFVDIDASVNMVLETGGLLVSKEIDLVLHVELVRQREHRAALTGQQFQSEDVEPYYVLFEDFTHVKFYRRSLYDGCVSQGASFAGFIHVDDWVPQRLVTATGPNPLPR